MSDKGLGVAAIGLEHFKAAMAGEIGDLDQVGAALHCGGHEISPQGMPGEGCSLEPEPRRAGLDDERDIATRQALIRQALSDLPLPQRAAKSRQEPSELGSVHAGERGNRRPDPLD